MMDRKELMDELRRLQTEDLVLSSSLDYYREEAERAAKGAEEYLAKRAIVAARMAEIHAELRTNTG